MKRIIAITTLAVTFAVSAAFGQGYFTFTAGKSQVYDGFTTAGTSALSSNVKVAFLWAASGTATPMPVASTPNTGNSLTAASWTVDQAWAAINNTSSGWTIAVNSANSSIASINCAANGGVSYNGGVSFGVTGTAPSTTYSLFMIGWNGAYADPTAAAAAHAAVGWSSVYSYSSVTSIGTGASMAGLAPSFGVFVPAAVPEPSTMALAALGGASLLLFRRRK